MVSTWLRRALSTQWAGVLSSFQALDCPQCLHALRTAARKLEQLANIPSSRDGFPPPTLLPLPMFSSQLAAPNPNFSRFNSQPPLMMLSLNASSSLSDLLQASLLGMW